MAALPQDGPSIVVLDELPYLVANVPGLGGVLQKVFDRELPRRPVLLIGVGSDPAMMRAPDDYGRPFHQRATETVVPPLDPADVADMLDLPAAEAIDAYLVSGGLPLGLNEWPRGSSADEYLADALTNPTSALRVGGGEGLAAESAPEVQARTVLGAVGSGGRSRRPGCPRGGPGRTAGGPGPARTRPGAGPDTAWGRTARAAPYRSTTRLVRSEEPCVAGYLTSGTAVSFLKASKTCLALAVSHFTADSPVEVR